MGEGDDGVPEYRFTKDTCSADREHIRNGLGREIPDAVRQMVARLAGRFVRFQVRRDFDEFEWTEQWLPDNEFADREAHEWCDYLHQLHKDDARKLRRLSFAHTTWTLFVNDCRRSLAKADDNISSVPACPPPPPTKGELL